MNFTQPPPNYLPQRTPTPTNLNQTKFTNRVQVRAPHAGAVRQTNHSFGPRHKPPHGQSQNIPIRHFQGRGPIGPSYIPGSHVASPGQLYQSPPVSLGQFPNNQVLKQQNGFHGVGHSQVTTLVQNNLMLGGGLGVGQVRPQTTGHGGNSNGFILNGIHHGQSSEIPASTAPIPSNIPVQAPSPHPIQTGVSALPHHSLPGPPIIPGVAVPGSQVVQAPGMPQQIIPSVPGLPAQTFQLPFSVLPQQGVTGPVGIPTGVILQQAGGGAHVSGGPTLLQQLPQSVQVCGQPGNSISLQQPGVQGPGAVPAQYLVQGPQPVGDSCQYVYQPPNYPAATPSLPQVPPPPVPPTPPSANIPMTQFPPPGMFSHPPPNYPAVSPSPNKQVSPSPRYTVPQQTPPKSPCSTSSPVYLSPPMSGLVPVYPLTPGPTPDCVPFTPPGESKTESGSKQVEIPDLRHQFLTNQFLPQPGQVVLLPPLPPDRSVQTIQLLTPGPAGQFSVQTIVLPIIKVENTQPVHQMQGNKVIARNIAPEKVEEIKQECNSEIIKGEDDGILLNEVDSTGLPKVMQGIDLEQVKQFAAEFKSARLSLGLTQTQVGQALTNNTSEEGVAVSQSTICRFEKLEITALQVKKLLPALQSWLQEAKERHKQGLPVIVQEAADGKDNKKRKKRTVFNQETVNALNVEFDVQPSPSSQQLGFIADKMGLDKETVRVWFCNKRQTLKKNTMGTY